jgi:hypothetical protein
MTLFQARDHHRCTPSLLKLMVALWTQNLFRPGLHDGAADWHLLDLDTAGIESIVLSDLAIEIEVLT